MHLVLRALSLNEVTLSQPIVGRFDERGGTIGRSNTATLALPDAERLISRVQANITYADSHYWLEDVSRANAVIVNGRPLGFGARTPLKHGDELRIGGYRLAVELDSAGNRGAILGARGNTAPRGLAQAAPGGGDAFADLLGPSSSPPASGRPNVFADLLTPTRPLAGA
jgi:FHA domain-containing protein